MLKKLTSLIGYFWSRDITNFFDVASFEMQLSLRSFSVTVIGQNKSRVLYISQSQFAVGEKKSILNCKLKGIILVHGIMNLIRVHLGQIEINHDNKPFK